MSIFLGIDPSLTATTIMVIKDGKPDHFTTIDPAGRLGAERLGYVMQCIKDSVEPIDYDLACVEGYAYGRNNRAHQMGEIGGIVRIILQDMWECKGKPWIEIAPTALKKFATGKAQAKKEKVMQQIYKRWKYEAEDNNEADAFVLAKMGQYIYESAKARKSGDDYYYMELSMTNKAQRDALDKPIKAYQNLQTGGNN